MKQARERGWHQCLVLRNLGMSETGGQMAAAYVWALYRLIVKRVQTLP